MSTLAGRLVEVVVPARLGRSFRWLLASTFITNAGDGILLAAGPLLVYSQTQDPFLVSLAGFLQAVPFLLFGLIGGALADRVDRKRMVIVVDLGRALVLAVVALAIVTGNVSIAIVLAALFLLGTCEVLADSASSTLLPGLVAREDLGIANARSSGAYLLMNQLVAPPIGAFLFVLGVAIPFVAHAVCCALGAVLLVRVVTAPRERTPGGTHLVAEMRDGFRWLLEHPPMRTLTLTILLFNVTFGAAWGVLVVYAQERLGLDDIGYGFITTAIAVGGLIGSALYGRLERRFSLADIMRVGLLIETATHLVLALTTSSAVALGTFVVFGAHGFVWGTTATVIRQRAVPDEVLGRVGGVYRMAIQGGIVAGTPLGGLLARELGITAPFWFGFVGSAVLVALLWREFTHIAHAAEE